MNETAERNGIVVVPTYNERDNLPRLVDAIHAQDLNLDILVVDDNSPDGTGEIADDLVQQGKVVHALHRPGKLGLGSAYVDGLLGVGTAVPVVFQMDADSSRSHIASRSSSTLFRTSTSSSVALVSVESPW